MKEIKIKKAVIREDLLSIVKDFKEAVILNQFIYWSERVSDADILIAKENEIAQKNGEEERDPFYGWIYKTAEELANEVMLGLSASQIRRYINALVEYGYISKRNNPKYKWDRTLQYKVNLVNIARALKKNGYPLSEYKIDIPDDENSIVHSCTIDEVLMENQSCAHERAIPETTTETTNRNYNTDNKKDALTSDKDRMDASFPKEKEEGYMKLGNKKISKTKYTQSELESYLPNKIRELYVQENLILDEYAEELVKIVMYFYRCYRVCRKEKHPILTDISYEKIVIGYLNPPETMSTYGEFTFGIYKEMIDKYFNIDFGKYSGTPKNFNYRISHFMNDTIREHLYRQLIES